MAFLDRIERRCGWLGFPGFLRYYALFSILVFVLQLFRPGIGALLDFDRDLILSGEVWRLVTFLFSAAGLAGVGAFTILFFFCGIMLLFVMSDALEGMWGIFRTSIFCYAGWFLLVIANLISPSVPVLSGLVFGGSVFFAFATYFPKFELRLFFVLPVQARFLAIIALLFILLSVLRDPSLIVFYLIGCANYILWTGIPAMRGQARVLQAGQKRKVFQSKQRPADEAFHRCKVCGRTEISDSDLDFRMGADGEEYCEEHLPK